MAINERLQISLKVCSLVGLKSTFVSKSNIQCIYDDVMQTQRISRIPIHDISINVTMLNSDVDENATCEQSLNH